MPLFVRAGSIVPTGPAIQYHRQRTRDAPLTLNVFTGADGSFSLYEDDGVSRQYLNGKYARIPFNWDEKSKTLTLGPREGNGYAGMAGKRDIRIRWIKPGSRAHSRSMLRPMRPSPTTAARSPCACARRVRVPDSNCRRECSGFGWRQHEAQRIGVAAEGERAAAEQVDASLDRPHAAPATRSRPRAPASRAGSHRSHRPSS